MQVCAGGGSRVQAAILEFLDGRGLTYFKIVKFFWRGATTPGNYQYRWAGYYGAADFAVSLGEESS